jgi:hypothetical protein
MRSTKPHKMGEVVHFPYDNLTALRIRTAARMVSRSPPFPALGLQYNPSQLTEDSVVGYQASVKKTKTRRWGVLADIAGSSTKNQHSRPR